MQKHLARIVRNFPREGLSAAFGYGSGVVLQTGSKGANMIDFIFAVDDPRAWHRANLARNPGHYSWLRLGGEGLIDRVQRRLPGPRVYFNTLVPMEEGRLMVKYGVLATEDLLADLQSWCHLYVAGRLHKPVEWVVQNGSAVAAAQRQNLEGAACAALLLLPEIFTETELFMTIAGLSYTGDFRMVLGEDRQKVENIVYAQTERFRRLYNPILLDIAQVDWRSSFSDLFQRDVSYEGQLALLRRLPLPLLQKLTSSSSTPRPPPSLGPPPESAGQPDEQCDDPALEVATQFADQPDYQSLLRTSLTRTVARSSLWQTGKSALTAGLVKSVVYASRKLGKMLSSMGKRWKSGRTI